MSYIIGLFVSAVKIFLSKYFNGPWSLLIAIKRMHAEDVVASPEACTAPPTNPPTNSCLFIRFDSINRLGYWTEFFRRLQDANDRILHFQSELQIEMFVRTIGGRIPKATPSNAGVETGFLVSHNCHCFDFEGFNPRPFVTPASTEPGTSADFTPPPREKNVEACHFWYLLEIFDTHLTQRLFYHFKVTRHSIYASPLSRHCMTNRYWRLYVTETDLLSCCNLELLVKGWQSSHVKYLFIFNNREPSELSPSELFQLLSFNINLCKRAS